MNETPIKLPPNFKLPNSLKTMAFFRKSSRDQRAMMLAYHNGEQRHKSISKRDVETYAENPHNHKNNRDGR